MYSTYVGILSTELRVKLKQWTTLKMLSNINNFSCPNRNKNHLYTDQLTMLYLRFRWSFVRIFCKCMVTPNFPIFYLYKEMHARGNCLHVSVQIGKFRVPCFHAFATHSYETLQGAHVITCTFQFSLFGIFLVENDSNWFIVFSLCIQDWKTGDRVLAKWQDCKFYPAKITKCLNDGKKPLNTSFEESLVGCPSNSNYTCTRTSQIYSVLVYL